MVPQQPDAVDEYYRKMDECHGKPIWVKQLVEGFGHFVRYRVLMRAVLATAPLT